MRILDWCKSNGFTLNPSKTQTCPPSPDQPKIVLENTEIDYSESLDILGVSLKFVLPWDLQVSEIDIRVFI
jgi:hypothetical protein